MTHTTLLSKITCDGNAPIKRAIASIEASNGEICLVVDEAGHLVGTITDGDVRRGLITGVSIDAPVTKIMKSDPLSCVQGTEPELMKQMMKDKAVGQIPIVDNKGYLLDIVLDQDLENIQARHSNEVVLMAGGLGTRLRPITENVPKPMIEVCGQPILKTILNNFMGQGFSNFTLCVNYLGNIIEDYFGDGSHLGARIKYVRETKRLGTAGALSLLEQRPSEPFIVMNGDILTNTSFSRLKEFHLRNSLTATMAVNDYTMTIPYGVVETNGERIVNLREKPKYTYFVNAGIYMLGPEALDLVPQDTFFDMPSLFSELADQEMKTNAFPIHEYWIDVGQPEDLSRAQNEIKHIMGIE